MIVPVSRHRVAARLFNSPQIQCEDVGNDTSNSALGCAFLPLMTPIALCRRLSGDFASWRGIGREQEGGNRRGQDKSRKVRPVGRTRDRSNFNHTPNIGSTPRNLSFLIVLRVYEAIRTLRWAR